MRKSSLRSILAFLSLIGTPAAAQGPLHVDITQGVASPLPIAGQSAPGALSSESTAVMRGARL